MTKRLHVNRAEGANKPRQAWSRSPSPLTSEAQSLTFHPHSPSPSRCPLHPITMKRPIRQISKDGRLRVITHDVSRQIKKGAREKTSVLQSTRSVPPFRTISSPSQQAAVALTARITDDTAGRGKKDVTLISPCAGLVIVLPRKGQCCGEPLPPFSNLVGAAIERARGGFTINQGSASLLGKQKEAGNQMTNPFSSQRRNYCWVEMRDQRKPPPLHGIPARWLLIMQFTRLPEGCGPQQLKI